MIDGRARALASFGIVAQVVWVASWAIEGERVAGYDWTDDFISELAATGASTASVMVPAFIVAGLGTIASGVALRLTTDPRAVPALMVFAGVAAIGAGLFRCDPGCRAIGDRSTESVIHTLTSVGYFVGVIAAALLVAAARRHDAPAYAAYSLTSGIVAAVTFALIGTFDGDPGTGLVQRISVVVLSVWTVVASTRIITAQSVDAAA